MPTNLHDAHKVDALASCELSPSTFAAQPCSSAEAPGGDIDHTGLSNQTRQTTAAPLKDGKLGQRRQNNSVMHQRNMAQNHQHSSARKARNGG
jgi:hypothetical protein